MNLAGHDGTYTPHLLLVEDQADLITSLTDRLEAEGFSVKSAGDGVTGERMAADAWGCEPVGERGATGGSGGANDEAPVSRPYDCIILDVMLPGRDGFQVALNLRNAGVTTPILMLTARTDSVDTVMGLRLGADDYLTKPFDPAILVERIRALIRRSRMGGPAGPAAEPAGAKGTDGPSGPNGPNGPKGPAGTNPGLVRFGLYALDTNAKELRRDGKAIKLHAQEYRLLEYLVANPGRTMSRQELLDSVWGYDQMVTTRTVDVHVARLREKLGEKDLPRHLITVRGFGYRFEV